MEYFAAWSHRKAAGPMPATTLFYATLPGGAEEIKLY
jgi:hypothetical protein